jgi:hypothetical protein
LDTRLTKYDEYGKGHTLPTFWALCDPCESIYQSGDDGAAIGAMHSSGAWSWVADEDVTECIGKPFAVFRRADKGGRPLNE